MLKKLYLFGFITSFIIQGIPAFTSDLVLKSHEESDEEENFYSFRKNNLYSTYSTYSEYMENTKNSDLPELLFSFSPTKLPQHTHCYAKNKTNNNNLAQVIQKSIGTLTCDFKPIKLSPSEEKLLQLLKETKRKNEEKRLKKNAKERNELVKNLIENNMIDEKQIIYSESTNDSEETSFSDFSNSSSSECKITICDSLSQKEVDDFLMS